MKHPIFVHLKSKHFGHCTFGRGRGKRSKRKINTKLTVNPHRSFGLAQRVFRHALVTAVIVGAQRPDGELHVRLVPVLVDRQVVLGPGKYHGPGLVEQPEADGPRVSFGLAVDRYIRAQRRAHQLIGHHQHRANCKSPADRSSTRERAGGLCASGRKFVITRHPGRVGNAVVFLREIIHSENLNHPIATN